MRRAHLVCAYACVLVLLCPLALSQSVKGVANDENQNRTMKEFQKNLLKIVPVASDKSDNPVKMNYSVVLDSTYSTVPPLLVLKKKRQSEVLDDDDISDDKTDVDDDADVSVIFGSTKADGKNKIEKSTTSHVTEHSMKHHHHRRLLKQVKSDILNVERDVQKDKSNVKNVQSAVPKVQSDIKKVQNDVQIVESDVQNVQAKTSSGWQQSLHRRLPLDIIKQVPIPSKNESTMSSKYFHEETTAVYHEPAFKRHMREFMNKQLYLRSLIEARPPTSGESADQPPLTREKVGMIVAFVGTLLVKQIPEDTFFDMEDGNTRNLKLMVRFSDRRALPPNHWLQFDEKTQELYGLPGLGNIGVEQYLVTAIDKKRQKAHHIINIKVVKGPALNPNVEFYITLESSYMDIAYSAKNKRIIIEKLAYVFGHENNTNIIRMSSITDTPTSVRWYNTTLPSDRCPQEEIDRIMDAISGKTKEHFKESVENAFAELKVMSMKIIPLNKCINRGEPPREVVSIYSGVSASKDGDIRLGASGIVNVKVGERKLVSFVIPTILVALVIFVSLTVLYLIYAQRTSPLEFMPCMRIF